jgi:hypothetical protein
VIYRRGRSMRVMVYAGRDPLTGRKKWVSRQVPGTGRAALKEAKQIEAKLLAEVAAGRHQEAHGVKVAELVDRWLEWRQAVKPMSPGTAANYQRCIDLKIKPALGDLAVSQLDTATLTASTPSCACAAASASTATGEYATASRRCVPARSSTWPSLARSACTRRTACRASR